MKKVLKKIDVFDRVDFNIIPREKYLTIFLPESSNEKRLAEKINEIIDYLNEKIHKQRNVKRTVSTKEVGTKNKE